LKIGACFYRSLFLRRRKTMKKIKRLFETKSERWGLYSNGKKQAEQPKKKSAPKKDKKK
tara:strand:+ start:560 stop:736 length:177 start_codon:yes stop_codon:yes gene_type:complete